MRLFGSVLSGPKPSEERSEAAAGHKLSFELTDDYPDRILSNDQQRFRAIGSKDSDSLYSIIALGVTRHDMKLLGTLKQRLSSSITNHDPKAAMPLAADLVSAQKTDGQKELLAYMLAHEVCGYGAISMLLDDSSAIEEIVVNSPLSRIGIYHVSYGYCLTNLRFSSEQYFRYTINRMISDTERELNSSSPVIDARLNDGSRVHAQIKPYAISGAAATIRLTPSKRLDIRKLMQNGSASAELLAYIWMSIDARMNITIAGAPASGKTSMLIALSAFMPMQERIITIEEDISELGEYGNFYNVVALQGLSLLGRPSTRDQVINALHLRPERIIVGEIRGQEAAELMAGANLGIPFMTTMHSSDDGQAVISRLISKPMSVEHDVVSNLDMSLLLAQNGTSRSIRSVSEYSWLQRAEIPPNEATGNPQMVKISRIGENGKVIASALDGSKAITLYSEKFMVPKAKAIKELKTRASFLKGMLDEQNIAVSVLEYMARYGSLDEKNRFA